ncbi:MAG: hypothetical protein ACRDXB_06620 [Actinomycetes bacterium]
MREGLLGHGLVHLVWPRWQAQPPQPRPTPTSNMITIYPLEY